MTRVLVVEDIVQNLCLLRTLLQAKGFEVEEARDGVEALAKARLQAPDLVVSDLLMPVMDGYALLRQWKTEAGLASIPFVVYTATYTDAKDVRLALAMGADAFLAKPAEPDVLMACLHDVLARARLVEPPAAVSPAAHDQRLLAQYNEVLVAKLEKRALQLEQGHRDLLDSEERFRATFEQAAVGIAHVGVDGRFLRVNDKLCEITGYPRDELLALHFASLTLPEDLGSRDDARQAMLAGTRRSYTVEKAYQRKDGSGIWVSLVSTMLRSADGAPRYFISVITDISERKALEEQVRQSQKLESLGQLSGGIAHDFNNLLTVIIGNAELLVEELAGDERLRILAETAHAAASRGAKLTQRLLAFARRQALEPRAVDVNELLLGMDRMLRRMLPEDIDITLVRGAWLWPALVDASQLDSAVLNLCINARDAMPAGGRLTLKTGNVHSDDTTVSQADLSPGAYVMVAVSDTGTGVAPEDLARVFDPFFTTKAVGKGTGLGLSMVYGFVKQSRGHVRICSELGKGTTVTLYLPRAAGQDIPLTAEARPGELDLHGSESILLVEDDEMVRRFAESALSGLGYRVRCAANGTEGLALVGTHADFDLLLTDVVMPGGMNGPQLAHAALALRPGLKVLFSSGYADNALVHDGRLDPGVNLLGKPYGRRELARKVRAVLSEAAGTAPGAAEPAKPGRLLILDDDGMVARILARAAERLGFEAEVTSAAPAFLARASVWHPSHVAIDLSMPGMSGREVLDRLAEAGSNGRVIIYSGADGPQIHAVLEHARARGLQMAGALAKPFSLVSLRTVLDR